MKELLVLIICLGIFTFYSNNFNNTQHEINKINKINKHQHFLSAKLSAKLKQTKKSKGISIKKLKLCDEKRSIHYSEAWRCPKDPTCIQCQTHSIKRHGDMLKAFEKEKNARLIEYSKYNKDEPIILVSLNLGYEKLFRNFICSVEKNNMKNVLKNIFVLPCEKESIKLLEEMSIKHSNGSNWMNEFKISTLFRGTNIHHHYLINGLTFVVMNEMIQEGYSVLLMDADIIFKKNPIPYLNILMNNLEYSRLDFVCQLTGRDDERSPCNTGFVFFRPTDRTKRLTQTLRNSIAIRPQRSDQLWFNHVIKNHYFQHLNYDFFDGEMFYKRGSHEKHTSEKILYHSVGPQKQAKFESYNDWYLYPE